MHALEPKIIIALNYGQFVITETVIFGWITAAAIAVLALWMAKGLKRLPTKKQAVAELIVEFMYDMTQKTMGAHNIRFAPYIGTLFLFLLLGNSLGLFGLRPITADVNMTFALALMTFYLIHYGSIRAMGLKGKLKHMCEPVPFMLPLNILEAITKPVSLGFRLFGNILAGVVVMGLLFTALGGLSNMLSLKIPIFQAVLPLPAGLFFDLFHPMVQAYVFTMLTMVFISLEIVVHGDKEGEHHS